jgi:cytochrome c oxidase subunit 1
VAARAEAQPQPYRADWKRGRVASWLTTVDHKRIGILYVVTSLFFFLLGGLLSLFMRAQLATPNEHFVTRDRYNELSTARRWCSSSSCRSSPGSAITSSR